MRIVFDKTTDYLSIEIENNEGKLAAKLYIKEDGTLNPDSWISKNAE